MTLALLIGVVSALAMLVIQARPALACSCRADVRVPDALLESDGAFVGVFVGRHDVLGQGEIVSSARPVLNLFQVERSVKGDIGERVWVEAAASGASCGLELEVGERAGLLLRGGPDGWRSGLCSQTEPNALLALAADEPGRSAPATGDGGRSDLFVVATVVLLAIPVALAIRWGIGKRQ